MYLHRFSNARQTSNSIAQPATRADLGTVFHVIVPDSYLTPESIQTIYHAQVFQKGEKDGGGNTR
jgi:hypothetical protein